MESEPKSKTIRQRYFLLNRLARIDRGRAFVLHHVARQQMAPIGRGIEDHILGPSFDAAFEHRFERFVGGVLRIEGEVVTKDDEVLRRIAQNTHQLRQRLDILTMNFNELQPGCWVRLADRSVGGFDQRGLPHAAGAPQKRIVSRQAAGKPLSVFD